LAGLERGVIREQTVQAVLPGVTQINNVRPLVQELLVKIICNAETPQLLATLQTTACQVEAGLLALQTQIAQQMFFLENVII
jgi:hypothetical protein